MNMYNLVETSEQPIAYQLQYLQLKCFVQIKGRKLYGYKLLFPIIPNLPKVREEGNGSH